MESVTESQSAVAHSDYARQPWAGGGSTNGDANRQRVIQLVKKRRLYAHVLDDAKHEMSDRMNRLLSED